MIVSDAETPTWVQRPTGSVIMDVWRTDALPVRLDESPAEGGELVFPAAGGVSVRIAVFPPDMDIEPASAAAYEASMQELYGDQGDGPNSSRVPGMHRTDTVDIVTVVDGEIWVVMDEGETLLQAGDCLVQRGTRHAWNNRSDRPCTLTTTMLPAVRS